MNIKEYNRSKALEELMYKSYGIGNISIWREGSFTPEGGNEIDLPIGIHYVVHSRPVMGPYVNTYGFPSILKEVFSLMDVEGIILSWVPEKQWDGDSLSTIVGQIIQTGKSGSLFIVFEEDKSDEPIIV